MPFFSLCSLRGFSISIRIGCFRNAQGSAPRRTSQTKEKTQKEHKSLDFSSTLAFICHPSPRRDAFYDHVWLFLSLAILRKEHAAAILSATVDLPQQAYFKTALFDRVTSSTVRTGTFGSYHIKL